MGGNSSSRLDSLESDDSEGVTIVKGVRVSFSDQNFIKHVCRSLSAAKPKLCL